MAGEFDDLVPAAPSGGGTFDDLVPSGRSPPVAGLFPQMAEEKLASGPHDTSIFGTAIPKTPGGAGNALTTFLGGLSSSEPQMPYEQTEQFEARTPVSEATKERFQSAADKIKETAKGLYEGYDPTKGPGIPGARPLETAGSLLDIARQAGKAAMSPVTGALYPQIEKYTGIPGEEVTGAIGATGASGVRAPGTSIFGPRTTPRGPSAPSALSPEFRAANEAATAPPTPATPPPASPVGDTPPAPRPGLEPTVRLLPPDLPVGQPVRDSVGAARAQSAIDQAAPEAVKILEDAAKSEGWTEHTLDQLESEQSPHHFLAESSPNFEQLTKSNQTLPGAARTEINQAVNQRHRERGERVNQIHNEYLGQDIDRTQWEATLRKAARDESGPFWRQFDQQVIQPTPEIEAVLRRPTMRNALAKANKTLLDRGEPIENGFPVLTEEESVGLDNAKRGAAEAQLQEQRTPTAKAFQLAKEHLDGLISDAVRSGRRGDVRTYTGLKKALDDAIAAHPNADIAKTWQLARSTYRGPMSLINAREIGENLLSGKTHYSEVPGILENMGPEQKQAVLLGLRNHMADVAGRPGAGTELRNIREALGPDNQRKIAAVIGPERADAYINALQQEEHMHFGPRRLTQGSDTAGNIAYQKLLQPPGTTGVLAKVADVAGKVMHPKRAAAELAMDAIRRGDETAAGKAAQRWQGVRADLGRLLTTQGPERDAIRRELVKRIQDSPTAPRQPLQRQVLTRDVSGRPIKTQPLPIGKEDAVIREISKRYPTITAFHGSPHDFDRFDLSRIGTGEGAQAYGRGLYFAEKPGTAESYRDAVTAAHNPADRQLRRFLTSTDENAPGRSLPEGTDISQLPRIGEERASIGNAELLKRARDNLASVQGAKGPLAAQAKARAQATVDYLESNPHARYVGTPYEGRMYQVSIKADPQRFLDWDKPLSQQSDHVRNALKGVVDERNSGSDVHEALVNMHGSDEAATEALRKAGIPGIRYLDQGSRNTFDELDLQRSLNYWQKELSGGNAEASKRIEEVEAALKEERAKPKTSNYVVFDDKLIKILEKRAMGGRVGNGPPMITRKQSNYSPTSGTKAEHCSNCSMFLTPHKCTAVAGFIAKAGKCDWYEAGREHRAEGGGIDSDPLDYSDSYNTPLSSEDESKYQNWVAKQSASTGRNIGGDTYDYDLRGYWKNNPDVDLTSGHLTDTYKKPNHPTFSTQSQYHGVAGNEGGQWSKQGNAWSFKPGSTNLQLHGEDVLQSYFDRVEQGNRLERASGGRTDHSPTEAQKEAGNYAKRKLKWNGLDISIENEKGSERSGTGKDGKRWAVKMPAAYGYIRGTVGKDHDHVDCYIGPHPTSNKVFIVDQQDVETKRWDEHKCMLSFGSAAQARAYYLRGFSDGKGKHRLGHMTEMTVDQFKDWLKNGDQMKPAKAA